MEAWVWGYTSAIGSSGRTAARSAWRAAREPVPASSWSFRLAAGGDHVNLSTLPGSIFREPDSPIALAQFMSGRRARTRSCWSTLCSNRAVNARRVSRSAFAALLVAAGVIAWSPSPSAAGTRFTELRDRATKAFKAKRYKEACALYTEAQAAQPADAANMADLALCLQRAGDDDGAVKANQDAIRLASAPGAPADKSLRVRKAAYYNLGRLDWSIRRSPRLKEQGRVRQPDRRRRRLQAPRARLRSQRHDRRGPAPHRLRRRALCARRGVGPTRRERLPDQLALDGRRRHRPRTGPTATPMT